MQQHCQRMFCYFIIIGYINVSFLCIVLFRVSFVMYVGMVVMHLLRTGM